jgi:hypothetical protein
VLKLHIKVPVALQSAVLRHSPSAISKPLLAALPMPATDEPGDMPSALHREMLPLAVALVANRRVVIEQLPMSPTQSAGSSKT